MRCAMAAATPATGLTSATPIAALSPRLGTTRTRKFCVSRAMSASALSQLRELMQYTAAYGTAAEAMSGLGPDYGAKTGSAEVDGQEKPNGWFTAYRGDLAAAGVVQAGGHGGDTAGPIVAALLRMGS